MQQAEVAPGVLRERGRQGLPLTQLYRQMLNRELYLLACGNIYSDQGAMTPGASEETADGMPEDKADRITGLMRNERHRSSPARRVYIPKKNGKLRPLGLPSWSDKLVGEVARLLLEAYYEPVLSDRSHGFRKRRGCHAALREINDTRTGTTWFIEGDTSGCFGSPDHEILLGILPEKIHDQRFPRLIRNMPKAGYLEDRVYHETLSGSPQGGAASPILSSTYLHKLDEFVERELIPQYTRGARRKSNPEYNRIKARRGHARKHGDRAAARDPEKQMRTLPSAGPMDPGYRRLRYLRYADGHIPGFTGPKAEAEQVKARTARFLRETPGLELNAAKTLITRARSQPARFLGYHIIAQHCDTQRTGGRRTANGNIALRVPPDVIKAQCAPRREHGKPRHRSRLQNLDDCSIVRAYGAGYRGAVSCYLLAQDAWRPHTLHWHALTPMPKTLAAEHRPAVTKMAARHQAKAETGDGPRTRYEARRRREGKKDLAARSGGITLRQDRRAVIRDHAPAPAPCPRKELIRRLRRRECELCETGTTVTVHQVTGLNQLGKPGPGQPARAALTAKIRRKTLILCASCHDWTHANPAAHAA